MTGRRAWRIGTEKPSPPLVQGERVGEAPSVIGAFGVPHGGSLGSVPSVCQEIAWRPHPEPARD
jgi:hypothetical protein